MGSIELRLADRPSRHVGRWLLIAGALGSIAFVLTWTVAGLLRPGYSAIHQPISDLGVGPYGWLMDTAAFIEGLLKVGFAVGFALVTRPLIRRSWWAAALVFLVLSGLAMLVTATFTDAPSTVAVHSTAAQVALLSRLLALAIVGFAFLEVGDLRGWGVFSLVWLGLAVALAAFQILAFKPGSPLEPAHYRRPGGTLHRGRAGGVVCRHRIRDRVPSARGSGIHAEGLMDWTKLDEQKTVLLTTYKRDGSGVDTPIHIAVDGGTAFIRTYAKAWKWKRLQRNPHVTVSLASTGKMPAFLALLAPRRSRRVGPAVRARVEVLEGDESAQASRALARKYPFLQGFLIPWLHRTVYRTATKNMRLVPE